MAQEKIQITIPVSNKWHSADIEKKANELGMEKSEFIMESLELMMNFDTEFFEKIKDYSEGLNIPKHLIIQNMIIKRMALDSAKVETETWSAADELLTEFQSINEKGNFRNITGEELFNNLKEQFITEIKMEKITSSRGV